MPTIELDISDFQDTVATNEIVFVDFWAAWCAPCRTFGPIYDAAAEGHPDLVFAKVNVEDQRILSSALAISSIPTLMAFKGGYLVLNQPGALQAGPLAAVIQQVRDLDISTSDDPDAEQTASGLTATGGER